METGVQCLDQLNNVMIQVCQTFPTYILFILSVTFSTLLNPSGKGKPFLRLVRLPADVLVVRGLIEAQFSEQTKPATLKSYSPGAKEAGTLR